MHPKYNERTMDYDIALLHLSTSVAYNDTISPVCLPSSPWNFSANTPCYVTGWGKIRESGPVSERLRVGKVSIIERKKCSEMYKGNRITDRMICAGYDQGRIDSCQGDSGGPLVCFENGRFVLAGAVSWGIGCAQERRPGVYTNVTYFRSWIDKEMS